MTDHTPSQIPRSPSGGEAAVEGPPRVTRAADILRLAVPKRIGWSLALAVLTNVSAVALLATSMWLIVRAAERPPILFLSFAVVGVRAFALGRAFFRYIERLVSHDAVFRQLPAVRVRLFERLAELAPWGITGMRRGDTLSRFVRDVDELQFYPLRVLIPSWSALIVVAASCVLVGFWSPLAALSFVLILAGGTLLAALDVRRSARRSASEIAPARGVLADAVLDAVNNWDVLVAYQAAGSAADRVRDAGRELSRREQQVAGRGGLANGILIGTGAIAICVAALAVSNAGTGGLGALSVPAAAVIVLLPIALVDVLAAIPLAVHARAAAEGAAARIAELLPDSTPSGIADERLERERELMQIPGTDIVITDLTATYPGSSRPAIEGVTFDLPAGELVLVTGRSGSGKSTIAQVLVRLLDYAGSVTLGGVELRQLGAATVRSQVVLCEQLPWLFHSTIRGNLQFARPAADDVELAAVIARVGLSAWMAERGGLDAEVGERGDLVSGGQAQRLALARALLSEAPVIICDEPTANVDPLMADALLRDIASLAPERSVLLISHQSLPAGIAARTVTLGA